MANLSEMERSYVAHRLAATYADAVGRAEVEEIVTLFVPDGRIIGLARAFGRDVDETSGPEAIRLLFGEITAALEFVHQVPHVIWTKQIGEGFTAKVAITEFARFKGGGNLAIMVGHYIDEYVETAGNWSFASRSLHSTAVTMVTGEVTCFE